MTQVSSVSNAAQTIEHTGAYLATLSAIQARIRRAGVDDCLAVNACVAGKTRAVVARLTVEQCVDAQAAVLTRVTVRIANFYLQFAVDTCVAVWAVAFYVWRHKLLTGSSIETRLRAAFGYVTPTVQACPAGCANANC